MKLIVAGSRHINDPEIVEEALEQSPWWDTKVTLIEGGCQGVDRVARELWLEWGWEAKTFHADWRAHGGAAGPMRNQQMAEEGDALLAIWDLKSRGTKDMVNRALKQGLPVFIWPVVEVRDDT